MDIDVFTDGNGVVVAAYGYVPPYARVFFNHHIAYDGRVGRDVIVAFELRNFVTERINHILSTLHIAEQMHKRLAHL